MIPSPEILKCEQDHVVDTLDENISLVNRVDGRVFLEECASLRHNLTEKLLNSQNIEEGHSNNFENFDPSFGLAVESKILVSDGANLQETLSSVQK